MRSLSELEARITLVFANSFRNTRRLGWSFDEQGGAYLNIDGKSDSYLVVLDHRGSGLIRLDGKPHFGLDKYHTLIPIPAGHHTVNVELSNYLDFGERIDAHPGTPFYCEVDFKAYRLYVYGYLITELLKDKNVDGELKEDLGRALSRALSEAYFESVSREQLLIASRLLKTNIDLDRIHHTIDDSLTSVFVEDNNRAKYGRALDVLKEELSRLTVKYGKRGQLIGVGHAHIDTAWLWPFEETRRKVARTFSTILTLLDKYDFHYIQSAAIYYEWVKHDHPELFGKIVEKIGEGKWELGALYVECDTNMLCGESLARQFLYSQRFYKENFGVVADVLWLPDSFGFTATLPQIARLGGVKAFATHKVFWNDTNTFPYNVFRWVAPNGDFIPAVAFGHGRGGYNSDFSSTSVLEQWANWGAKNQPMLYSYGYGDGGGGPNEEMLLRAEAINTLPILPRVTLGGTRGLLSKITPVDEWRGELYLETHRGVLTSHSKIKRLNRRCEVALREAELWCTLAGSNGGEEFAKLWKILLKNQFHDVLPGSAIREVYEEAYRELEDVAERADSLAYSSMCRFVGGEGDYTYIFNSLPWERAEYIFVEGILEGQQRSGGGCVVKVRAPAVGYTPLQPLKAEGEASITLVGDQYIIENKYFVVRVDRKGRINSIFDREAGREVLKSEGNLLVAYENIPGWADAWDIEKGYGETSFTLEAASTEVLDSGPLLVSVRFTYKYRKSEIEQILRVYSDSRRIDFLTTLRMKDRELLVKSHFNFDLNVDTAVCDTPFGVTERYTWGNTSWDKARFEVPIQKFVDMCEHDYGVALLNDGKYGVSLHGGSVGLSLTRTPIYPDPTTDLEEVSFTYSLYPHQGDWKQAEVVKRAYELNTPLRLVRGKAQREGKSLVGVRRLMLEAVKQSEDAEGIILRLYEYHNSRGEETIELPFSVDSAESLDLLELNKLPREITVEGNRIKVKYLNRDILTLKVKPKH
ncbi:MAG: alpha-mannosidase [Thermoprotei archaeon]